MTSINCAPTLPPLVPCGTCPYRKDVSSGIWHAGEYRKLPRYDKETAQQPTAIFLCHQQDGRACAGWVAVHDMDNCLGLRIALACFRISVETYEKILDYKTDVPLFESGASAAAHGLRGIKRPSNRARRMIETLVNKRSSK